jgi:hypothetical protein
MPSTIGLNVIHKDKTRSAVHLGNRAPLWIVLGIFGMTCFVVNPLQETTLEDDWAYALTVRYFFETGHYRLHDWAAANMPFQVYWGSAFSWILGYSPSSLRLSTLALVAFGLAGFYSLARQHDLHPLQSGLVTLALFASPLVLYLSFSFMTDVPFLMLFIIALSFYTRAVRLHSYTPMLLGSGMAAAAILTRQFGIALIGGLLVSWIRGDKRARRAPLYLAGIALPAAAAVWQLAAGTRFPNWAGQLRMNQQLEHLGQKAALLPDIAWRLTVVLQYLALFALPFAFAAALILLLSLPNRVALQFLRTLMITGMILSSVAALGLWVNGSPRFTSGQIVFLLTFGLAFSFGSWWLLRQTGNLERRLMDNDEGRPGSQKVLAFVAVAIFIVAGMVYAHSNNRALLMPNLHWLGALLGESMGKLNRGILTVMTSAGAVLFGGIFVLRYVPRQEWRNVPASQRLLDWVTIFIFLLHAIYVQFGDEYIIVFLPFTLIVVARHLGYGLHYLRWPVAAACLVMLAAVAMLTRARIDEGQALWTGGELARMTGADPARIYANWGWNCYHGAADDHLKQIGYSRGAGNSVVEDFFTRWLPERQRLALFRVVSASPGASPEEGEERVAEFSFRDWLFRERRLYVIKRKLHEEVGGSAASAAAAPIKRSEEK